MFDSMVPATSRLLSAIYRLMRGLRLRRDRWDDMMDQTTAVVFFFPSMLHLCFFGFVSCATTAAVGLTGGGLSRTGASPSFRVVLVCRRSKMSFSAYTIGWGRMELRFALLTGAISRFSAEELEFVLLPEETTGETSSDCC